jgi:hypothetical protein
MDVQAVFIPLYIGTTVPEGEAYTPAYALDGGRAQ